MRGRSSQVGVLVLLLVLLGYLRVVPPAPDLAVQVARAEVVHRVGLAVWWPGWIAGLHLPTYSELGPLLIAALGAPLTGVLAAVAAVALSTRLLQSAVRPRLATGGFAVMVVLNLLDGRITFLVGVAFACGPLVALRSRRVVLAVVLGAATCLASPLAALFLGVATAATALAVRTRRRVAVAVSLTLVAAAGSLALLFPGAGVMPAPANQVLPAVLVTALVGCVCPQPAVRWGALLLAGAALLTLAVPSAVGQNITRMTWLLAAPVLVGYARSSQPVLALLALGASVWPAVDVTLQLSYAGDPSAHAAFYQPLLGELGAQLAAHPGLVGERVEVVDPRSHGSDRYVAAVYPLARGWDRQADQANNPLFYQRGALNAATYRGWLDSLAVGWVAVPAGALDYASGEARLVRAGLPYLRRVWSSPQWQLYAVQQPAAACPGCDHRLGQHRHGHAAYRPARGRAPGDALEPLPHRHPPAAGRHNQPRGRRRPGRRGVCRP